MTMLDRPSCSGQNDAGHLPLAMSYTPMQRLCETYDPVRALLAGTLFPELDKPFCGRTIMGRDRNA